VPILYLGPGTLSFLAENKRFIMANDIKILPSAVPHLPFIAEDATIPVKAAIKSAIGLAASIDGNKVLDTFEAEELAKVHAQIVGASGTLTS